MNPAPFLSLLTCGLLLACLATASAETCEYDTRWGVLTMEYNWNTYSVVGNYPYKGGTISGAITGQNSIEGTWFQTDGSGYFVFNLHQTGFSGRWRYAQDGSWRGSWDGTLRGCY